MPSSKPPTNSRPTAKKSKTPLIVGAVLGVVVLAGVALGATMMLNKDVPIINSGTSDGPCPPGMIREWDGGAPDNNGKPSTKCYTHAEIDQRKGQVLKPVIMLYADRDIDFTVAPQFGIRDGYIYPALDHGSWSGKLLGGTDGNILIKDQPYSYLFWEGVTGKVYAPTEGNVVARADTTQYLERALKSYGLNAREREDFITFWVPRLIGNDYNLISFVNAEYAQSHPLKVTPTPDYTQRVFMVYKKVDQNFKIPEQRFGTTPARHGFSLIEWGGQELN